ncbi:MAG: hypothetical protein KIT35_22895 [Piscinibacter sp.]|uniref:hypothetical protein n=1 Tax=Piscinibacter sp. TaxID=1903157 RepID=UPI00258EA115|nr:hypothetical protein [Piscinibacter sp.]MCW5666690.1 hypothetical protein [Piscinibacter sp.]
MSTRLSVHDHLREAQAEAVRFHGSAPVRAWRPARDRRAGLAAGALGLAIAATLALLAWRGADEVPATTVAVLDAPRVERPSAPQGLPLADPQDAAAAAALVLQPAATAVADPAAPAEPAAEPLPPYVPPADPEAWALHPPLAPEPAVLPAPRPLFNTPELPDEPAAPAAVELAPEDDSGGGNVEPEPVAQPG